MTIPAFSLRAGIPVLALPVCLLAGCGTTPEEEATREAVLASVPGTRETDTPTRDLANETIALIQGGDFEGAHDLLGILLLGDYLEEAQALLEANSPEDGLALIDRALSLAPRDTTARKLKGEGSIRLAEKGIAEGRSALVVEGALTDALDYYQRVDQDAEACFGASRAAWLLGRPEEALRLARRGMEVLNSDPVELSVVPERVLSEAAFSAYTSARQSEDQGDKAQQLFTETEEALSSLIGREGSDAWVWGKLSDLYEWEEMYDDAQAIVERGLDRFPEDRDLFERLARVTRRAGGAPAAIEALASFNQRHPANPMGLWYEGKERFDHATERLLASEPDPEEYDRAERLFAGCREVQDAYTDACKGYEVMCRNGVGWCLYQEGDLEGATQAFLSMEEILERGMEWKVDGQLLSGVQGLEFVGGGYNEQGEYEKAGDTFALLRDYQPEVPTWANNAGFFYRDAAVEMEFLGRRLCRAALGELQSEDAHAALRVAAGVTEEEVGTPAEAEKLTRAANETLRRAVEVMRQSGEAYMQASKLAPEDVRVVNDTALVLVYYLHEDIALAEELLRDCVEMGAEQLEDRELDEDARWELENAWGDAHQNLGVLYAIMKDDKLEAQRWLERSIEIGPDPRPLLSEFWLPYLRGEVSDRRDLEELKTWGQPCDPSRDH